MKKVLLAILLSLVFASVAAAADWTITIPNDKVSRITDAFTQKYGYQAVILNPDWNDDGQGTDPDADGDVMMIDNPVTPGQFSKAVVIEFIKQTVKAHEAQAAAQAAAEAAAAQADTDMNTIQ